MYERMVCVFVAFLSSFGVFYSSKNMEVYRDDIAYAGRSNYVDVYLTDVQTVNGSDITINSDQRGIQILSLSSTDVISYEIFNNSSSYDVVIEVLVNGVSRYEDENIIVECSNVGTLSSGESFRGTISIQVLNDSFNHPEITFQVIPIQKGYLQ